MKKRKSHSLDFKAKVAPEAGREEMTLTELSKKYGARSSQIGTWKRAATENMATAYTRRGGAPELVSSADVDKLHSKIGQLVVERVFGPLSCMLACTAGQWMPPTSCSGREVKW